ncbi:MAG: PQQ-like beta-propeller repeat protein [Armatimonadetes bacterium]|nr:PQQ-like beta-propeller repeat protein [Armatimonadota bacterium]
MKLNSKTFAAFGLLLGLSASIMIAVAQEYPGYSGGSARTGRLAGDSVLDNPGKLLIRWADPTKATDLLADNWDITQNGVKPFASFTIADWDQPTNTLAGGYVQTGLVTDAEYRFTTAVASGTDPNQYWIPQSAPAREFSWGFPSFVANDQVKLSVSIPSGPTDVGPNNLHFQAKYQVYRIDGVANPDGSTDPVYEKVNTFAVLGGSAQLGGGQPFTVSTTGALRITLINTVPRDANGVLEDVVPPATNFVLVYADSATAKGVQPGNTGTITAQPVVGKLADPTDRYPFRVFAGRNETASVQVGSQSLDYNFGILSSYRHNGLKVDQTEGGALAFGGTFRRNLIGSWPAVRPLADTQAETDRFALEVKNWINANGRAFQTTNVDNLSFGATKSGIGWTSSVVAGNKGVDVLSTPAVTGAATVFASFQPRLPQDFYRIRVFTPTPGLAKDVFCEVRLGSTVVQSGTIDMSVAGWHDVIFNGVSLFENFGDLNLRITNLTSDAGSVGNFVQADQVQFIRQSKLAITSTPYFARAQVNDGGVIALRDVVVVAMENGHLYCLDATGFKDGAGQPTGATKVYWSYPSDLPTGVSDPNLVVGQDGPSGIAEMPTGFDTSSAAIKRVTTTAGKADVLYIGSANGKVYSIDMTGRGDNTATQYGTTSRRWSWPDDYPSALSIANFGAIQGSVAVEEVAGKDLVYVPTMAGRLFALDADGDTTKKTTTVSWQYPAAAATSLDSISMAPVVETGLAQPTIFFGSGSASFFALNAETGAEIWKTNVGSSGTGVLSPFGASSPVVIGSALIGGGQPDTVYYGNPDGYVYARNAATGAQIFSTAGAGQTASQPLAFSYMSALSSGGIIEQRPVVIVPCQDKYVALRAGTVDRGLNGEIAWQSVLKGAPTPVAFSGRERLAAFPYTPGIPYGATTALLDEEHTVMMGADATGNLIGYGWDEDFLDSQQYLPPGQPPIDPVQPGNDPTLIQLADVVKDVKVGYILENKMYALMTDTRNGLSPDISDMVLDATSFTRRQFEYGERLNLIAWDLPDPASFIPALNYSIEFSVAGPSSTTLRRTEQVRSTPFGKGRFVVTQFAVVGTGNNAVAPGPGSINVRAVGYSSSGAGQVTVASLNVPVDAAHYKFPASGGQPLNSIVLNNPLGLSLITAGATPVATTGTYNELYASVNGNPAAVGTQVFAPDLALAQNINSTVGHNSVGLSRVNVWDRSCMSTLLGFDRGLPNVRFANRDLVNTLAHNLYPVAAKPLPTTGIYAKLEQPVWKPNGVNTSLDYPDISRDQLTVIKQAAGDTQNPLFTPVVLDAPRYTVAQYQDYKSNLADFNPGLARNTNATVFDLELATPRFQPPSGYVGRQYIFVDSLQTTKSFSTAAGMAYREFDSGAGVAADEQLSVGEGTVDLGGLAGGSGISPALLWNTFNWATGFSLDNAAFNPSGNPFFNRFSVFNEGNTNLLNVRVAKQVVGNPFLSAISGPTLHPQAFLDTRLNLLTDLDPNLVPTALGGEVFVQKARPGDLQATRLRVNPTRRANAAFGAIEGPILNVALVPQKDPKIAVATPFGTPMGSYSYPVTVFEDRVTTGNIPVLGFDSGSVYEPYADPFTLKFQVTETRLTSQASQKGAPMIDDLGYNGNELFRWANQQPSMARDADGNALIAFASPRLDAGGAPNWTPKVKLEADNLAKGQYRIFLASLRGVRPGSGPMGNTGAPLDDLNGFTPANANQWFIREATPLPGAGALTTALGLAAGESVEAGSLQVGLPTFPSSGVFASSVFPTDVGRTQTFNPYLAFVAEFNKVDGQGNVRRESRLLISRVTGTAGSANISAPIALTSGSGLVDPTAKIGRLSMVQDNSGRATVFFTVNTGGQSQLGFACFNGTNWVAIAGAQGKFVETFSFNSSFETIGNPSAFLRAVEGNNPPVLDLAFAGRVRGKSSTEIYFTRMEFSTATGQPTKTNGYTRLWDTGLDPMQKDPATGIYWVRGIDWDDSQALQESPAGNVDPTLAQFPDVFVRKNGLYQTIFYPGTRKYDPATRNLSGSSTLGGTVTLNLSNGSIKFDGAIVGQNTALFVRYRPRFVRVSAGQGANYSSLQMVFDDRLTADANNWFNAAGTPLSAATEARVDRWVFSAVKSEQTSGVGGQPVMKTLRFGTSLSKPLAFNNNGQFQLTVAGNSGPYQVDTVNNRVYFQSQDELNTVTFSYQGLNSDGSVSAVVQRAGIGVVEEKAEFNLPVVPGVASFSMTLDAQNTAFNNLNAFNGRRAGLIWFVWTGSQKGTPDIYVGSMAPMFSNK